jgi:hypothetical protein
MLQMFEKKLLAQISYVYQFTKLILPSSAQAQGQLEAELALFSFNPSYNRLWLHYNRLRLHP